MRRKSIKNNECPKAIRIHLTFYTIPWKSVWNLQNKPRTINESILKDDKRGSKRSKPGKRLRPNINNDKSIDKPGNDLGQTIWTNRRRRRIAYIFGVGIRIGIRSWVY